MEKTFRSSDDIKNSINHLKDTIIRTPEYTPHSFIKHAISEFLFPLSLIFNCSLAIF